MGTNKTVTTSVRVSRETLKRLKKRPHSLRDLVEALAWAKGPAYEEAVNTLIEGGQLEGSPLLEDEDDEGQTLSKEKVAEEEIRCRSHEEESIGATSRVGKVRLPRLLRKEDRS